MQRYTYTRLENQDDIRILNLQSGTRTDRIVCTLTTWKDNEQYEGLSWQWALDPATASICIKTEGDEDREMKVKPNLESTLRQLRHVDKPRALWIDAICIDQDNDRERSSQVAMMAAIYGNATSVCVWLGEEEKDSSDLAISFVKDKMLKLHKFDELTKVEDNKYAKEWDALYSLMRNPWFTRRWVVQGIALTRKATLYCGDKTLSWSDFADAVALFETVEVNRPRGISQAMKRSNYTDYNPEYLGEVHALGASRLVHTTSSFFRRSKTGKVQAWLCSLEMLVSSIGAFEASRPHDTIYGVLALAKDVKPQSLARIEQAVNPTVDVGAALRVLNKHQVFSKLTDKRIRPVDVFPVDYEKSFFEVCKDFIRVAIDKSRSLDVLCRPWAPEYGYDANGTSINITNLPSWILKNPNYPFQPDAKGCMLRNHADTLVGLPGFVRRNYAASGLKDTAEGWDLQPGPLEYSLFVKGFILCKIKEIQDQALMGNIPGGWLAAAGWTDKDEPPPDQLWRTLVADRGPNGLNAPSWYARACSYAAADVGLRRGFDTKRRIHDSRCSVVGEFFSRVQCVVWNRRLFRTAQPKSIGLAPNAAKKGDLVCILYGCSVPVVLRKIEHTDTDDHTDDDVPSSQSEPSSPTFVQNTGYVTKVDRPFYQFIGECYLHGMMDGEAITEQAERKIEPQKFELR